MTLQLLVDGMKNTTRPYCCHPSISFFNFICVNVAHFFFSPSHKNVFFSVQPMCRIGFVENVDSSDTESTFVTQLISLRNNTINTIMISDAHTHTHTARVQMSGNSLHHSLITLQCFRSNILHNGFKGPIL